MPIPGVCDFDAKSLAGELSPDPPHRDDRPIPRKGRPLISPIGMNLILLAAGPGFARILFYTGFTKKGFSMAKYAFN